MPLAAGTRQGPYETLAPLGAGGMGKSIARMGRDVAAAVPARKVSPTANCGIATVDVDFWPVALVLMR
jgi:hypothetical protein